MGCTVQHLPAGGRALVPEGLLHLWLLQVDMIGSAVTGYGSFVCMGDADGELMWWDTRTGQAQMVGTGGAA